MHKTTLIWISEAYKVDRSQSAQELAQIKRIQTQHIKFQSRWYRNRRRRERDVRYLPSMLLKTEKGVSNSTRLRPFLRQASSTRGVRRTITTGVISSNSIKPSGEFAGSNCPRAVAIVAVVAPLSECHWASPLGFNDGAESNSFTGSTRLVWELLRSLSAFSSCDPTGKASRGGLWPVYPLGL